MKSQTLHPFDLVTSFSKKEKTTRTSAGPTKTEMIQYLRRANGHPIGLAAFTK
ncbi:hypothetical protein [Fulvivirga sp.]|uniref:hypothetical protein n=1 Tax=Fulvivirga sp. TaxID=1931237 RepID=UPI0032EED7EA